MNYGVFVYFSSGFWTNPVCYFGVLKRESGRVFVGDNPPFRPAPHKHYN